MSGDVSIGLAGALGPDLIGELAPRIERAGFAALWVNDTPGGDSIAALAAAAAVTTRLRLGTGVIPVDRRPAESIADAVTAAALPADRVLLGIGSGRGSAGVLDRMRHATEVLHERTSAAVVVGALGPRLRALAAQIGDGVLFNWLPVSAAAEQAAEFREARAAGAPGRVTLYVRTITEQGDLAALEREAAGYAAVPAYAANFERLGVHAIDTTLPLAGGGTLAAGIRAYADAVDEVVLRAITADNDRASLIRFIEAAAEALPR